MAVRILANGNRKKGCVGNAEQQLNDLGGLAVSHESARQTSKNSRNGLSARNYRKVAAKPIRPLGSGFRATPRLARWSTKAALSAC
jgi:hypothetical protein